MKNHTQQRVITKGLFQENKEKAIQFFSDLPKENFDNITENIELSKYIKMFPKNSDLYW